MALEAWQRYKGSNVCPICGGKNAGKKENRCKGYLHHDGIHAFCGRMESNTVVNLNGLVLYKHTRDDVKNVKNTPKKEIRAGEWIEQQEVTYEGLKRMGEVIPSFTVTWYVFYRDGVEITRDQSLERVRLFSTAPVESQLPHQTLPERS